MQQNTSHIKHGDGFCSSLQIANGRTICYMLRGVPTVTLLLNIKSSEKLRYAQRTGSLHTCLTKREKTPVYVSYKFVSGLLFTLLRCYLWFVNYFVLPRYVCHDIILRSICRQLTYHVAICGPGHLRLPGLLILVIIPMPSVMQNLPQSDGTDFRYVCM